MPLKKIRGINTEIVVNIELSIGVIISSGAFYTGVCNRITSLYKLSDIICYNDRIVDHHSQCENEPC